MSGRFSLLSYRELDVLHGVIDAALEDVASDPVHRLGLGQTRALVDLRGELLCEMESRKEVARGSKPLE